VESKCNRKNQPEKEILYFMSWDAGGIIGKVSLFRTLVAQIRAVTPEERMAAAEQFVEGAARAVTQNDAGSVKASRDPQRWLGEKGNRRVDTTAASLFYWVVFQSDKFFRSLGQGIAAFGRAITGGDPNWGKVTPLSVNLTSRPEVKGPNAAAKEEGAVVPASGEEPSPAKPLETSTLDPEYRYCDSTA
jgi:hypothetical protein